MPKPAPEVSSEELTTLLHLVKLGAVRSFAPVTTGTLGESMGLSQQAASLRLAGVQKAGLVERAHAGRGLAVRLTDRGLDVVEALLADVGANLERGKTTVSFRGTVFTGLGEGRYYVSLKGYSDGLSRELGFVPFPGTLNLRLTTEAMIEQRRRLELLKGIQVPGFSDGKRSYGPVKCFRAKIAGKHPGAVLAIERTHHDNSVLEVISPLNLRKVLGLKDGDECIVIAYLGEGWARRR
ncbi:MAG: CTP-dependent riboflavin kinase [Nitrososphaerota archaeon]|nr:CTP-dependent riboflavin kinase [Nitrososphaerota archaeon]